MLKAIDDLGLAAVPVEIRTGVRVMAVAHEPEETTFAKHRLQPSSKDDRLLASLLEFGETEAAGHRVVLLSADGGLRVKARARGIEVVAPPDELANSDEPDETERELAAAQRELAALRTAAPKLRLTIEGDSFIEGEVRLVKPLDATTRSRLLKDWRERFPHIAAMPDNIPMPGGGTFSLNTFSGLPGFVSSKEAKEYNAKVDRVFERFERYLDEWHSVVNGYARSLELKFRVENSGTAPADDVHITLRTEADGVWLAKLPDPPKAPALRKRRDPFDFGLSPRLLPEIDYDALRPVNRESDGPDISTDDPKCVEYWERRVKHHVPRELDSVHFRFASNESVGSFAVQYRLIAANIREPQTGVVHVKLTCAEPVDPPVPVIADDE